MRILGVDPGSSITGWAVLEGSPRRATVVDAGTIRLPRTLGFPERLAALQHELALLVARLRPEAAAVESPFHGSNARSSLQLAQARGVILATLAAANLAIDEYSPATVKKSVTGSGSADKEQVKILVCRQLGYDDLGAGADLTDALAIALCHLAHCGRRKVLEQAARSASKPSRSLA